MEAKIVLEYSDLRTAKAIAEAISPENFKTPDELSIKTLVEKDKVITNVNCRGKMLTFVSTIDDLLFSASVAEKAVHSIKKANGK